MSKLAEEIANNLAQDYDEKWHDYRENLHWDYCRMTKYKSYEKIIISAILA